MADDDFKWDEVDEGATVVNEARETAVYVDPKGDMVIRQRGSSAVDTEDPFVFIPMYRVPALIERLQALVIESKKSRSIKQRPEPRLRCRECDARGKAVKTSSGGRNRCES